MNNTIYHVVVSNAVGSVRSSDAVLTVVQDTTGPLIRLVTQWVGESNSLRVDFNEAVTQVTAENKSNYVVHLFGSAGTLSVTQASWGGNYVRLRLSTNSIIDPTSNYVVCIYGLADSRGNVTHGDCLGMSFTIRSNLVPMASCGWRYADVVLDDHLDRTNWTAASFREDPNDWGGPNIEGCGLFWYDGIGFVPGCSQPATELVNYPGTQYFRKRFTLGESLGTNVTMVVTNMVDDGAVFYLNGVEIQRVNMPAGTITWATRPSSTREGVTCAFFEVPVGHLLTVGTNNLLAVELHQVADEAQNNDMIFDASVTLTYPRSVIIPELQVARSANNLVLTWQGTGFALETATNIFAPTWQRVPTTNNRYPTTVPAGRVQRFYRLVNP